jgi:hypothetical protein
VAVAAAARGLRAKKKSRAAAQDRKRARRAEENRPIGVVMGEGVVPKVPRRKLAAAVPANKLGSGSGPDDGASVRWW